MARLVKHEQNGPYEIAKGEFPLYICACGLSKNKPYCDGSHKQTQGESSGEIYVYGDDGRVEMKTEY